MYEHKYLLSRLPRDRPIRLHFLSILRNPALGWWLAEELSSLIEMSFFTMEDPAPFSPNLWMFEVRMNIEWTLHYSRVWCLATRLVEGWIGIYHSWPRRNKYEFHSCSFLFVLTYFGLFGKHHNDIDVIKEWSIDIAGLHIVVAFQGRIFRIRRSF